MYVYKFYWYKGWIAYGLQKMICMTLPSIPCSLLLLTDCFPWLLLNLCIYSQLTSIGLTWRSVDIFVYVNELSDVFVESGNSFQTVTEYFLSYTIPEITAKAWHTVSLICINIFSITFLKSKPQRLANYFCKGLDSKYF